MANDIIFILYNSIFYMGTKIKIFALNWTLR